MGDKRHSGVVLIVDVHYGLVLSPLTALNVAAYVYFDSSTTLEGASLRQLTSDMREIFREGTEVEFILDPTAEAKSEQPGTLVLHCARIRVLHSDAVPLTLQPVLVVQATSSSSPVSLGLTGNGDIVALHPQVATYDTVFQRVVNGLDADQRQFEDFESTAVWGRTVEGRLGSVPYWFSALHRDFTKVDFLLYGLQDYGRDQNGFAVIKKVGRAGLQLEPLEPSAREEVGPIYFPKQLLSLPQEVMNDRATLPKRFINGKFWYRACRELPGRDFAYRAYQLVLVQEAPAAQMKASKESSQALSTQELENDETIGPCAMPPLARVPSPKSLLPEDLFVVEVNQSVTEVLAAVNPPQAGTSSVTVELPSDSSPGTSVPATPEPPGRSTTEGFKDANNNNEGFWFTRSSSYQSADTDVDEAATAAVSHIVETVQRNAEKNTEAAGSTTPISDSLQEVAAEPKKHSKTRKSTKDKKKSKHPSMPAVEGTIIDFAFKTDSAADEETTTERTEVAQASPSATESVTRSDLDELAEIFEAQPRLVENIVSDDVYGKFFGELLANQKPASS